MTNNNVSNIEIPFLSVKDFLLSIYAARNQSHRLEVVLSRLDAGATIFNDFGEHEIACLVLLASAEVSEELTASDDEIQKFHKKITSDHGEFSDSASMQQWTDRYGEINWRKRSAASRPIDGSHLDSIIQEANTNHRVDEVYLGRVLDAYRTVHPDLLFLLSSSWWGVVANFDELDFVYGQENPFRHLSDFFGRYFYGRSSGCPTDGGPIPKQCSSLLKSFAGEVLKKNCAALDADFVNLAEVALGTKPPSALVKLLGEIEPETLAVPEKLSGLRIHLACVGLKQYIEALPRHVPDDFGLSGHQELYDELTSQFLAFNRLAQVAVHQFKTPKSITKFKSGMTARISETIAADKMLVLNVSSLVKSSSRHLWHVDAKTLRIIGDATNLDESAYSLTELAPAIYLLGLPTEVLKSVENLWSSYVEFVTWRCLDAPVLELGVLTTRYDPYVDIPLTTKDANSRSEFLEKASTLFAEDVASNPGLPRDTLVDAVLELSSDLLDLGLSSISSALLAAWIEGQATFCETPLLNPFGLAELIAKLPREQRRPVDIALSRALRPDSANSDLVIASIFPELTRNKSSIWTSEDQLKKYLGEDVWISITERTRAELIAAEETWQRLERTKQRQGVESYRGLFAHWGPVIELEFKLLLSPVVDMLQAYEDADLSDRKYNVLRELRRGRGSLLEIVDFISGYDGKLKPTEKFEELRRWMKASAIFSQIFDKADKRKKWREIGELRNLSVHDGVRVPEYEEMLLTYIYLFNHGLLREIFLLGQEM